MTKNFISHLLSSGTESLILESGIPLCLVFGEQFTQICNDVLRSHVDRKNIILPTHQWLEAAWKKIKETERQFTSDGINCSPIRDEQGNIQAMLLVFKEVSEKFEAIFYETPAAMALLNGPDFIFEKVNQKFMEIIQRNDLIGKSLFSALPELQDQSFFEVIRGVFTTGIPYSVNEMPVMIDSKSMYLDFSCTRLDFGDGRPYGLYIHAVDNTGKVTDRKNIEEALKARDEFISIASHELKTPLTSLKLQTQLQRRLIDKNDPRALEEERIRQFSEATDTQITKLNRLVDDMLDISRIRSGKLTINPDIVDLGKLILNVIDDMRTHFTINNFPVVNVSHDIVGTWDSLRIEQVIANLLTNAVRYGLDRPISIEARKLNGLAIIKVQDSGIGISREHHAKIFDRFERINPKEVSGLGLGLFLTKQIIQAHNGTIFVESEFGKGSLFVVELPINQVFPPGSPGPAAS